MKPIKIEPSLDSIRQTAILLELAQERERQDKKWGLQDHAFAHWNCILMEEIGEMSNAFLEKDRENLRTEMVQSAAVLISMLECGDRNGWFKK